MLVPSIGLFKKDTLMLPLIIKNLKHINSFDYQYLQKSKIPTLHFQDSLPRLPIPKLNLTCERYLAAQKPLLIDEAYRKIEANVLQFKKSSGRTLQDILKSEDKKNKHTSYISEPWFDMYLRDRKPLPINYNPMLVFNNDQKMEYNNQLIRTTNILISSLRFYKSFKAGILKPDVYHLNPKKSDNNMFYNICSMTPRNLSWYVAYLQKAYPLDMSQYPNLFNSSRIPEIDKDRIILDQNAKHILVQRNGHFYVFDVFDDNGNILPANRLLARLKYVINNAQINEHPIGVLTTLNRNKWATLRHNLSELGNNNELKIIDTAIFNICLDDDDVGSDPVMITRKFLHADGKNRWFDKSFSLIVSKDGVAGVNFEHSWGDGVAVLRYFQEVFDDTVGNPQVHPDTKAADEDVNNVQRLDIKLNDGIKNAINDAQQSYKNIYNSMDINWIILEDIGKNICKKYNVSPDAVMQLGFQTAFHKKTGKFVASYESCSTAAFKHGRTETIRPCTSATKAFCETLHSSSQPSKAKLKHLLSECSNIHGKLTREAAMGQGFDRHLFALRRLAEELNMSCNIFQDPAYKTLNHNIISTSTLNSPSVFAGGFGPVVKDGYGISYVIKNDSLGVLVSNYAAHRNGREFIKCLKLSFEEICDILRVEN